MVYRFLLFVLIFLLVSPVIAGVRLNEVQIEPEQSVELLNDGDDVIDISGWYIDDSGGSTFYTVPSGTILAAHACLVFTGDFNFNKASADTVRLFDKITKPTEEGTILVDSFSYPSSNGPGISFMRIPDGSGQWASGGATFSKLNSTQEPCMYLPAETPTPVPVATTQPTEIPVSSPSPIPVTHVFLNEAMVRPDDGEKEWVELYNGNNVTVALQNWYIDDIEGGSSPKLFSLELAAYGYAVIEFTSSLFNNSEDSVRLLNASGTEVDRLEYEENAEGLTVGRDRTGITCQMEPTRGTGNSDCKKETIVTTVYPVTPKPTVRPATATPLTTPRKNSTPAVNRNVLGTASVKHPTPSPSLKKSPRKAGGASELVKGLSLFGIGTALVSAGLTVWRVRAHILSS